MMLFKNQKIAAYGGAYRSADDADISDRLWRLSVGSGLDRILWSLTNQ
jgi:hypothetical protein